MATRDQDALDYHSQGRPGKIEVVPTKPCLTQRQLSLAYTPGVAVPCNYIAADPALAYKYTNRGNLVAVVSNGTAVLGLGNIGALAGKPVMEGKGVLFKRFGHVDVFDINLDSEDPDEIIRACQLMEPTFGGINLEDIKAPECFYIEEKLKATMKIPVFHDDQHGTAIIVGAGLINAVLLQGKELAALKVVVSGAGAAAIAVAKLIVQLGVKTENITLTDSKGVVYKGRKEGMNPYKELFAHDTKKRTLAEALVGADALIGVSTKNLVSKDMLKTMADKPIVFAMANPDPEITYEDAREARPDAIIATGRSDYPNQINNVLGFPFIFRGALDVRATMINEEMKMAAAHALADLARRPATEEVSRAYGGQEFVFGPEYIIPKPFDTRVFVAESTAVAKAACDTGVALAPITDWDAYRTRLEGMIHKSWEVMTRMRSQARAVPRRIVFAEGGRDRVLEACRILLDENLCQPILLGNEQEIAANAQRIGLNLDRVEVMDPLHCAENDEMARIMHEERARKGCDLAKARRLVERPIHHGVMMLRTGRADGMVCGATRSYVDTIRIVLPLAELQPGRRQAVGMHVILAEGKVYIFADTTIAINPDASRLVDIALTSAQVARHFGLEPVIAMLSYSNFGDNDRPETRKVREAVKILHREHPDLRVDGEMHADVAVGGPQNLKSVPDCRVQGEANVLVFPDLQSANTSYKLVGNIGQREVIGPLLYGLQQPINIVSVRSSVSEIVNMAALSAYEVGRV
ncbi:MAG: NADP-dependent malic enzyme [Candidatus Krumholzibacteria bacterium]|jgi:malate dehydrogenase (oxaloacetate-decarboxylating)(NADP+)|nr:NADP-dependent malic enzyme [Candidatus Krumholzibacteria bacterium]